jgi:hypothetical protein
MQRWRRVVLAQRGEIEHGVPEGFAVGCPSARLKDALCLKAALIIEDGAHSHAHGVTAKIR